MNASHEVTTFQAARPPDRWSSVANCRATSYGSLKVELIVPVRPSLLGDRGQRGQHGEGVRPADDVEVVDLAVLLAQPQTLGEEEEVELAALGDLREVDERVELDVAARPRVAPHRGVVHAREVGGEVDLLAWAWSCRCSFER